MSFFQIVLCGYRYIVITLSLSLVSCSHFKNTTANNENEVSKKPMPERSVAQSAQLGQLSILSDAMATETQLKNQRPFDELKEKLNSGKPLSEREMGNLFRALQRGADPGNLYTLAELVGPSARDRKGNTLLHWAVSDKGVVGPKRERLFFGGPLSRLVKESDVTIRNKAGETALDVAEKENRKIEKRMDNAGRSTRNILNRQTITGWVLEELAEATRSPAVLSEREMDNLFRNLGRGIRPRSLYTFIELVGPFSRDSKGNTLLHWAVSEKGVVGGKRLFGGAPLSSLVEMSDITIQNEAGETALDVAEEEVRRIDRILQEGGDSVKETIWDIKITGWVLEELVKVTRRGDSNPQEKLETVRGRSLTRQERRSELAKLVEAAENKILEEAGLERSEISEGGCPY